MLEAELDVESLQGMKMYRHVQTVLNGPETAAELP